MSFKKMTPEEIRKHKGLSFPGVSTVFICHDGKGRIFLHKRSNNTRDEHDMWDPGGGGLKHGWTLEDNLKRELLEEYDVIPKKVDFITYFDALRTNPEGLSTHWVGMYFAVLVDPKDLKINEPDMVDDFGWFTMDNLPSPLHSIFTKFVAINGEKIRSLINEPIN